MNKNELLKKILKQAKKDKKNREDPRFINTMAFLVAKGFLQVNFIVPYAPNKHLQIEDAIWAGQNVEPRILEVLPSAVLRLPKHFDFNPNKHNELHCVLEQLRKNQTLGDEFFGIPYEKLKQWRDFPLRDRRIKQLADKKITKTFRLKPEVVAYLAAMAKTKGCTETAYLEQKLLSSE